jgi:hypothetical protein
MLVQQQGQWMLRPLWLWRPPQLLPRTKRALYGNPHRTRRLSRRASHGATSRKYSLVHHQACQYV